MHLGSLFLIGRRYIYYLLLIIEIVYVNTLKAAALVKEGEKVIVCSKDIPPKELEDIETTVGVLTFGEGLASPAAIVSRMRGKTAVSIQEEFNDVTADFEKEQISNRNGVIINKHDIISLDGKNGFVYAGPVKLTPFTNDPSYAAIISWAKENKRMSVLATANNISEVVAAIEMGAEGVSLLQTETLWLSDPEKLCVIQALILASSPEESAQQLKDVSTFLVDDYFKLFRCCPGKVHNHNLFNFCSFKMLSIRRLS